MEPRTQFNEKEKLWNGCDVPPLFNSSCSAGQILLSTLAWYGSKIAQISDDSGIHMTFNEIRIKTIRAAQNLQNRGYRAKEVFGLMAKISHQIAPIVFSSFCIGCPLSMFDSSFSKAELLHMLKITKPSLMFCDVEIFYLVAKCLKELGNDAKIFTFGGVQDDSEDVENLFMETGNEDFFIPVPVDPIKDAAAIICSSGTTGPPKGVCISHASIIDAQMHLNEITHDDTLLNLSPMYWISATIFLIKGTISGSTRIITTHPFSVELLLRLVEKYKVTCTFTGTYQMVLLLKNDLLFDANLTSLHTYYAGGTKVPFDVAVQLNKILPNVNIIDCYGLTELSGSISSGFPVITGKDSVGPLNNGIKAKIIDEEGNRCGLNVDGQICLKRNYPFIGYYADEESSKATIDNEGFVMTGDIGHFDEDGLLYIVDREKDMMRYYSHQISPSEIESYLIQFSEIKSVCVFGVSDGMGNDLPTAAVIRSNNSKINEKSIVDAVSDHFADHKKLRGGVYFVESFPTTRSGKVLRRKVKQLVNKFHRISSEELRDNEKTKNTEKQHVW